MITWTKASYPGTGDKYDGYHVEKTFPNLKDEDIVDWHSVDYCVDQKSEANGAIDLRLAEILFHLYGHAGN